MVSAEEDAASDAGFAGISEPFVDVVGFGVARVWRTPSEWSYGHGKGVVMPNVFSQEFKVQIVELSRRGGRTFMDIGKEFNLSPTTVSNWVRAADRREGRPPGRHPGGDAEAADKAEIDRLRRELAQKEEELEILGKALAFFARRRDQ